MPSAFIDYNLKSLAHEKCSKQIRLPHGHNPHLQALQIIKKQGLRPRGAEGPVPGIRQRTKVNLKGQSPTGEEPETVAREEVEQEETGVRAAEEEEVVD